MDRWVTSLLFINVQLVAAPVNGRVECGNPLTFRELAHRIPGTHRPSEQA